MKKVSLAKASRPLAQYASELTDEILVVTEGNRPLAALVPLRNVSRESLTLSSHPEFMKLMNRARGEFRQGKTISLEEMRNRVRQMRSPDSAVQPSGRTRPRTSSKRKRGTGRG